MRHDNRVGEWERVTAVMSGQDGRRGGRSLMVLASAIVGFALVAAVVRQDTGNTALMQQVSGSWARDHSADPNVQAQSKTAATRLLSAKAERSDAEHFYEHEIHKDAQKGSSSARAVQLSAQPKALPVGSWAFDHTQKAGAIKAAVQQQQSSQPAGREQAIRMRSLAEMHKVQGEKSTVPKPSLAAAKQADSVASAAPVVQGSWTADHAQAKAKGPAVDSALALAEHLKDVKVVQQAVSQHEGKGTTVKVVAGSWALDHGSSRAAVPKDKMAQRAVVGGQAQELQQQMLQLRGPDPGGMISVGGGSTSGTLNHLADVGSAMQRMTMPPPPTPAGHRAGVRGGEGAAEPQLYKIGEKQPLGSWAADHGKILTATQHPASPNTAKATNPQAAAEAAASHAKDELAVAAGLKFHGDKL